MKNEIMELFDNEIKFAEKMQLPLFVDGFKRGKELLEQYFEEKENEE